MVLFGFGGKIDAEAGWGGCGSPMMLQMIFLDSRGIFQIAKKHLSKKYLFFEENDVFEKNISNIF